MELEVPAIKLTQLQVPNNHMTEKDSEDNVWVGVANFYALIRVLFWCLFSQLRRNDGNKHQK